MKLKALPCSLTSKNYKGTNLLITSMSEKKAEVSRESKTMRESLTGDNGGLSRSRGGLK